MKPGKVSRNPRGGPPVRRSEGWPNSGQWDQAIALLRQALNLDKGNIVVQNTLVNLLVERGDAQIDTDAAAAEPLAMEATRLDPDHPSVKKVIALIAEAKRKQNVERILFEASALQNTDLPQALNILKRGLTAYPREPRIEKMLANLQKDETRALGASAYSRADEPTVVYSGDRTGPRVHNRLLARSRPPEPRRRPKPAGPSKVQTLITQIREMGGSFAQNTKARLSGESSNLVGVLIRGNCCFRDCDWPSYLVHESRA